MAKYFNLFEKVRNDCRDIDNTIMTASCTEEANEAIKTGNHFMLRHIATNTAVLVDMIERLVTDAKTVKVNDTDIADALIDAYMRRKGQDSNDN